MILNQTFFISFLFKLFNFFYNLCSCPSKSSRSIDICSYYHYYIVLLLYFIIIVILKCKKDVRIYNLEEIYDNKIIDNDRYRWYQSPWAHAQTPQYFPLGLPWAAFHLVAIWKIYLWKSHPRSWSHQRSWIQVRLF